MTFFSVHAANLLNIVSWKKKCETLLPCEYEKATPSVLRDLTHATSVLCQLQFSRSLRGRLALILSVTMFSNYHSLHTSVIA